MVVREHRPDALLEVRGGHDLTQLAAGQTDLPQALPRGLYGNEAHVEEVGIEAAPLEHQLGAPARAILGDAAADGGVALLVASTRLEDSRDVLDDELNREAPRPVAGQRETLGVRLALGQAQPQNMPGAHGLHGERRAHRAVHAAAHRDDDPAAPQRLADLNPKHRRDPPRFDSRVELQPVYYRGGHSSSRAQGNARLCLAAPPVAKFEPSE